MRRLLPILALLAAGCGGGDDELRVSAATSLRDALTAYAEDFDGAEVRLSFGGSDQLVAQVRRGAPVDVVLVADAGLAAKAGELEAQTIFAANTLVVAVPARDAKVRSISDLAEPGVRVAMGSPGVPAGRYARRALARMPELQARVIRNVRSEEPDVAGVVGKVASGAVDAGFVYATDVRGSGGRLKAIELPPDAAVAVEYAALVPARTERREAALRFVAGLQSARELEDAGFVLPGR